jgi:hypothetical protein
VLPYLSPARSNPNSPDSDALKKGTAFESFIVRRFDPEYFNLIEWRSDKTVDGIFPAMSKYPDLEFQFKLQAKKINFAIECKWRRGFRNEKIVLDSNQIDNYKYYQEETGNPTYLVLGIGNSPSYPVQVYIIPIGNIDSNILHEFEIEIFRRENPHDNFFLHWDSKSLR